MNNLIKLIAFFSIFSTTALSQQVDTVMMHKIVSEEKANSKIGELAFWLTNVNGPRISNSPAYNRAVSWAMTNFNEWGLKNVMRESCGKIGEGWSFENFQFGMRNPYYKPLQGFPFAFTGSTNGTVTGGVIILDKLDSTNVQKLGSKIAGNFVMVDYYDSLARIPEKHTIMRYSQDTLGKLGDTHILSREGYDNYNQMVKKVSDIKAYLLSKGALALMGYASHKYGILGISGIYNNRSGNEQSLPHVAIGKQDYLDLERLVKNGSDVNLELNVKNNFYKDDLNGYNVIAEIPGTDPVLKEEVVMLGGHLDSYHTSAGASDDGAGCIVTMEAVRLLMSLNIKPRRTIRIALWDGEELGLIGSKGYVMKHFGNPNSYEIKPEQKKISVYFNLDLGSGKIRGVYLQNNQKVFDIFKSWLEPFNSLGASGLTLSNVGSSDHLSFDAVGIPAFQFIQDPLNYGMIAHTNMDNYSNLFLDDLKISAIIVAAFVYNAAMRDEMLPRKLHPEPGTFVF